MNDDWDILDIISLPLMIIRTGGGYCIESESERNLANKISRGGFTAAFLFQCLAVIGCQVLRLDDLPQVVESA